MPTEYLPLKKIVLGPDHGPNDMRRILTLFQEACLEEGLTTDGIVGSESAKKMLPLLEKAFILVGFDRDAVPTLPRIERLKYDPKPLLFRDRYRDFLFQALSERRKEDENDTEKETIKSRFVLVYELLVRLASLILCQDMEADRDGDILIAVLNRFTAKVSSTDILDSRPAPFQKRVGTEFHRALTTGGHHRKWLDNFASIVSGIKFIDSNTIVIENIGDYLYKKLHLVRAFLLAEVKTHPKEAHFSAQHVRRILEEKEARLTEKAFVKMSRAKKEPPVLTMVKEAKEAQDVLKVELIIYGLPEIAKDIDGVVDHIRMLYQLQQKTLLLLDLVSNIRDVFRGMGWLAICSGMINLQALKNLLELHRDDCNRLLVVPEYMKEEMGGTVLTRLLGADSLYQLGGSLKMLDRFHDPEFLRSIKDHFAQTFSTLCQLQEKANVIFNVTTPIALVDTNAMNKLTDLNKNLDEPNAPMLLDEPLASETAGTAPSAPKANPLPGATGGGGGEKDTTVEPEEDPDLVYEPPSRPATPPSGDEYTEDQGQKAHNLVQAIETFNPELHRSLVVDQSIFKPSARRGWSSKMRSKEKSKSSKNRGPKPSQKNPPHIPGNPSP